MPFFSFFNVSARLENDALEAFLKTPELSCANVGVLIKNMDNGKVLMSFQANKALIPGSNLKLITTATALNILGPTFRFETPLEYDGTIDSQGILHGNIYIVGKGDPTIGSSFFPTDHFIQNWIDAVKGLHIHAIDGQIVADISAFDSEVIPPDWVWEDMGNYYAAGVYGLSLNDNMYRLAFKTDSVGTTPQIIDRYPNYHPMIFDNYLKASSNPADLSYLHGAPYSYRRTITGTIPANRSSFVIKGDLPNPPLALARYFTDQLRATGIPVAGIPTDSLPVLKKKRIPFFIQYSPQLSDIINITNHESNNLFAEHIFKQLALTQFPVATRQEAVFILKNFWASHQFDTTSLFIEDGSGLSPFDGVTPEFFVHLLMFMQNDHPYGNIFFNSLPIAGKNGTLKNFLVNTSLDGNVFAKSGSIKRVLCYSGYAYLPNKKKYVFSVMVNNFYGSYAFVKKAIEKLLLSLH
ncbi:MAG: D-alanyl-D-alanine carboxypeptidase/D-alanyl-D-alanine endopeptidase [Microbacter sp.]